MTQPTVGDLPDWSLESETAARLRSLIRRDKAGRTWRPGEHSPSRLVLLAVAVGVFAGIGAVLLRDLIGLFHNLAFSGTFSIAYDANVHTRPSRWGAWVILAPVAGAAVVAFLVKTFAPEAKGHGVPEVIDSIYYHGGVIRPMVALVKAVASSVSIGSGGSVGREGPIIQIGSAFGSTIGMLTKLPEWQRITLVACGAAGGIGATFNTPIGGLLFAVEVILPEISARTIIPVALAASGGTFIGRAFFGDHPSFDIPALALPMPQHLQLGPLVAYVFLGLAFGVLAHLYIRTLYTIEDRFEKIPGGYYTRHLLGMLIVGVMIYLCQRNLGHYYIDGIGYATVQDTLTNALTSPYLLFLLFFAKLIATSLTIGSGGSGGVFSPSLFMGATFGAGYAALVNTIVPTAHLDLAGTAVIGMAALVGAATGAVVTAFVMIFEMTRDYNVIVPVIVTASIAYGVRRLLLTDSIYSMKLTRRGHAIPDALHNNLYMLRSAVDFVSTPMRRYDAEHPLSAMMAELRQETPTPHVLTVRDGKLHGVLSARRFEYLLRQGTTAGSVGDHARTRFAVVHAKDEIFDVLAQIRVHETDVAVVTSEGRLETIDDVVGVVTWNDLLMHGNLPLPFRRRRHRRSQPA
jgi:CIC family chloride channel protein